MLASFMRSHAKKQGLIYQGWELHKAGKRDDALRVLDLAAELAAMQAKVAETPDDFRAVQRLDYDLARQNRFEEIVTLWTGFIARHPDHGRAYLERGGAYHHLGRATEARADAKKACDLGITEACQYAK